MRSLLHAAAMLVVLVTRSDAQSQPGTRIKVDINVVSISRRADTTRVEYVARNHPTSKEELFELTIDAPSPVTALEVPPPRTAWFGSRVVVGRSVARWAVLDALVLPGQSTPTLALEAIGLPGIVTSWVRGYFEPTALDTSDVPYRGPPKTVLDWSVKGFAVGVEPYPTRNNPTMLVARLDSLTARACGDLRWIASTPSCTALRSQLGTAATAIASRDIPRARAALVTYRATLASNRGPHGPVSENAYWLLSVNSGYVEEKSPSSDPSR